jgi:hypothetical protein
MSTRRFRRRLGSSDFDDKRDFQLRRLAALFSRLESFVPDPIHVLEHAATVGFSPQFSRVVGLMVPHRHPSPIRAASSPRVVVLVAVGQRRTIPT